ncbi:hypothetical protein D9M71_145850 [compost metagenome]
MDGQPAEHGLDTKPAAGYQGADQARHIGTEHAERRAQQHRERDAVLGAREGIEGQGDQHDDIGQEDRQQRLPHRQAEIRGQYTAQGVGRYADRHADPQGGDVPFVPGSLLHLGRGDVVVVARAVEYIATGLQLIKAVLLGDVRTGLGHGRSRGSGCSINATDLPRPPGDWHRDWIQAAAFFSGILTISASCQGGQAQYNPNHCFNRQTKFFYFNDLQIIKVYSNNLAQSKISN